MRNFLQILNLVGVLALAALCVVQWETNRTLNLAVIKLETTRTEMAAQLAKQAEALKNTRDDLNDFRARLTTAKAALDAAATEKDRLTAQRDALRLTVTAQKTSLDNWMAAVAARDAALKKSGAQIQSLAKERNDVIEKFNALVKERNDVIGKFNKLAKKYNTLATQSSATQPAATRPHAND